MYPIPVALPVVDAGCERFLDKFARHLYDSSAFLNSIQGDWRMSSVIKKRKKKMRKHKYEKMRKKMRHERRKRGK